MKQFSTLVAGLIAVGSAVASPTWKRESLSDCLNGKKVPVSWTNSPDYEQLAKPFNLRLPYKPVVIVLPETNQHVQDAVTCAAENNVKVQAKSGGHSYASFSSGGKDGSMMIDLQPMQNITLDQSTGIAKVGGGVRLGNLAQGIYDQGKKALSHGTCPGVGLGGHATHGGYGHTSRTWGLALDHIVGADVVLANGTLVHATDSSYPQIFWAIRGAADSFGVITTFYLRTHDAPESLTFFSFAFGEAFYATQETWTGGWLHIQEVAKNASVVDDKISWGVYLDGSGFSLSGTYFGSVDDFNNKIKTELLRTLPTPTQTTVKSYGWIDYLILLGGADTITEPLTGYDAHDNFFAQSITVPESAGLTSQALDSFYTYVKAGTDVSWFTIINLYGGVGSQINTKDTNFAAYADRDSLWVFQNYGEGAESIDWIKGLTESVVGAQPQTKFGAYLNYVDPSYDAQTAHELYYREELYGRLLALKKEVDPQSVFWNPQAIGA